MHLTISFRGLADCRDHRASEGPQDIQGPPREAAVLSSRHRHRDQPSPRRRSAAPNSFAEVERIGASHVPAKPKAGTLGLLINEYQGHAAFQDLATQTRADYQKIFTYLQPIADTPLHRFDRPLVVRIRDKAAIKGRRFANYVKAVLSIVFGWGSERAATSRRTRPRASRTSAARRVRPRRTDLGAMDERHAALEAMPAHMRPALALMMFTALGPKDALTLPRNFFKDGEIATRRAKTGEPVFWRAPAELVTILATAPTHCAITLCASSAGTPWTLSGFRASWRKVRMKLEANEQAAPGTDALRPSAHRRGDPSRDGLRRAHYRRCAWSEDDRDGAALREGRRPSAENARGRHQARR